MNRKNAMDLNRIAYIGRTYFEYRRMFGVYSKV